MTQRGTTEYQKPRCSTLLTADQGINENLAMADLRRRKEDAANAIAVHAPNVKGRLPS